MDQGHYDETARLEALCALGIMDTPAEPRFDRFTALASAAFGVPIALISLVDGERQWFKSRHGLEARETPRSMAFCSYALTGADTFIVNDTVSDPRFAANPLVTGAPHIRFYAGHPVKSRDGHALGTLCIIDRVPRSLLPAETAMLAALAGMVEAEINRDSVERARLAAEAALQHANSALEARVRERTMALEEKNDALNREIRQRADVEASLRHSEERLRTITDNVPVLISYIDNGLRYRFANAMYKEWLGVHSADMLGKTVTEVFGEDYFQEQASSLGQAMSGHMSSVEVTITRKGHARILNTTYMPHHRDGKVAGVYVLATDATSARLHENKLLALANADPLTGLPNRRMYEFHLQQALASSRRADSRIALMYLDLDNFKRINDNHGHGAGDAVLVEFGCRVGAVLRDCDLLARLAGDEFTVVLDGVVSLAACEAVAAKIQEALLPAFTVHGRNVQMAASIGVALGEPGISQQALSARADEALYAAKRGGKGRCVVLADTAEPAVPAR